MEKELDLPKPEDTVIGFTPVTVVGGRKYRGNCFILSSWKKKIGYVNSGVFPRKTYWIHKAFSDVGGETVYFNGELYSKNIKQWDVDPEIRDLFWKDYLTGLANQCAKTCGNDEEYRHNYLAKVLGTIDRKFLDAVMELAIADQQIRQLPENQN